MNYKAVLFTLVFGLLGLSALTAAPVLAPTKAQVDLSLFPPAIPALDKAPATASDEAFVVGGRLGGGFKSIKSFKTSAPRTTSSGSSGFNGGTSVYTPGFMPFFFLPFPVFGGTGDSILTLIVLGLAILWAVSFFRKRFGANRQQLAYDKEEKDELGVLYGQCRKNLDVITEDYLKAQRSLEVLKGKIPDSRYAELDEDFGTINLSTLEGELTTIQKHMDQGELSAARPLLYSFDEDAEKIYQFLDELNEEAKSYLRAS